MSTTPTPNYLEAVLKISRAVERGSVTRVSIFHDDWCARNATGINQDCNCNPEVRMVESVTPRCADDKVGRNDRCSCGSGVKYKKCHGAVLN